MKKKPHINQLSTLVLLAALTACGGGDDDSAPGLKQYVGLWKSPCVTTSNGASGQTWLEVKAGPTTDAKFGATRTAHVFNNRSCAGNPARSKFYYVDGSRTGAKESSAGLANKVEISLFDPNGQEAPSSYGELMVIRDGHLYLGDRGNMGGDGYPADVDLSVAWTR
ncbi:MAG: hypothetical protein CVU36_23540 [Betaproteobacteria bacterium HGW-Betaproteobacteria-9]|jgi:hypothetical protein|nr:MAG: hypothetical protein CVU36_23540 [Betaproteobacteria bacterium HGW-Betaproteobacteria-9]